MSHTWHCATLSLLLATILSPATARAQRSLRPAGVDLGLGLSFGRGGGMRHHRNGLAATAAAAWHLRAAGPGVLVVAATASTQGPFGFGDDCVLLASGGCAPNYPGFHTLGLLGGWGLQSGARSGALRVLAGPAAFHSREGATRPGVQARADVATPAVARVALTAWGQAGVVPQLRGERYHMAAFGIGLRVR